MIFISYTKKDNVIVDGIVQKLAAVFGQENIFYDQWSIQSGDGIIDKMNEGLRNCRFFFFFVSKHSLISNMVKLEWQNAIYKATNENVKIIPVKLDDYMMPDILLQTLYIDIFGQGLENGLRQMIDVIEGRNTYRMDINKTYQNIRGYIKEERKEITIEFRAETYLEPISRYLILLENNEEEIKIDCISDSMYRSGFAKDMKLNNGLKSNGLYTSVDRGTTPGFPFIVKLTQKTDQPIKINGSMRAVGQNKYQTIPLIKDGLFENKK